MRVESFTRDELALLLAWLESGNMPYEIGHDTSQAVKKLRNHLEAVYSDSQAKGLPAYGWGPGFTESTEEKARQAALNLEATKRTNKVRGQAALIESTRSDPGLVVPDDSRPVGTVIPVPDNWAPGDPIPDDSRGFTVMCPICEGEGGRSPTGFCGNCAGTGEVPADEPPIKETP